MVEREPLSVTVITLDEEANLDRCLESVAWADEIVVVDSGSTDRTLEIAARHGCRIFENGWPGYVAQKNFALDQTSHDWVLSLDADEWLGGQGAEEVRRSLANPSVDGFRFNRSSSFCGAVLRHTWSPDWQLRLFRKDRGRFAGRHVHESVRMQPGCRIVSMEERLNHLAYRSISDYADRLNRYTSLAAAGLHEAGVRASWSRLGLSPLAAFIKFYLLRQGFRDGVRGFVVSVGSAFYVLLKYAKLWELSRNAGVDPEASDPLSTPDR